MRKDKLREKMVHENKESDNLINLQRNTYNRRYEDEKRFDLDAYPMSFLDLRLRRIWQVLPHAPTILDIGCGSGSLLLRQRPLEPFSYVGGDLSHVGLVHAQQAIAYRYSQCNFVQSVADDLPFQRAVFDGVFAVSVIEHLPDPSRFLDQCARVLKTKGLIIVHTPNPEDLITVDGFLRRFFPRIYLRRHIAAGHDYRRFINTSEMRRLMEQCGFEQVNLQDYTDTLVEWFWEQIVVPTIVSTFHGSASAPDASSKAETQGTSHESLMRYSVKLYNRVLFPLIRLMCWPDRLIESTGNSGGYIMTARRT